MNEILFLKDVKRAYRMGEKEVRAVDGVSLIVPRAAISVIIGPSGAGKSTLLHVAGGLDRPSSGTVSIDGEDIYGQGRERLAWIRNHRVGFVFQFYHLLPELTVLQNVAIPGLIAGRRQREVLAQATEILARLGMSERMDFTPERLSGGEKQRVAIARALINDPHIVLCDEPTGNLDSESGRMVIDIIKELNRSREMTFLIVTHHVEIAEIADEVLYMKDGQLERIRSAKKGEVAHAESVHQR